jgi:hypothetical protein
VAKAISAELTALLAEVANLKELYASARKSNAQVTRGKYTLAINTLTESPLPFIELDSEVFTSDSESGMKQQFHRAAEKGNLPKYTCVFVGDKKLLVDFDDNAAEQAWEDYILSRAGITKAELLEITADLDNATK